MNSEKGVWVKTKEHPEAKSYVGEDIIFSDGTSVLGTDNKAAITIVMEVMDKL